MSQRSGTFDPYGPLPPPLRFLPQELQAILLRAAEISLQDTSGPGLLQVPEGERLAYILGFMQGALMFSHAAMEHQQTSPTLWRPRAQAIAKQLGQYFDTHYPAFWAQLSLAERRRLQRAIVHHVMVATAPEA